ncbi:Uncharacterised protein [uncultured archaeon]|nr:Uncharacterised protein [uncultured archaeon]
MDQKSLEFLVWIFSIDKFAKSTPNPAGFNELCSFAEDIGYKKIGETKEGLIYQDGVDKLVISFPENYNNYNKK